MGDATCTITELAREFGLTTRAIRFYEDQGLLAPKRVGRNRIYNQRDRVRLKLTLRGKRLGFALSEIKQLLDMYDAAKDEKAQIERFLEVLARRRSILEQQREDIEAVLAEISAFEKQCREILAGRAEKEGSKPPGTRKGLARA
ncbi:MAG TPA: MerR family DNA-binding transcriptional regulator [Burkholderiales bacterium]|nr:MerR family DNA-binding transcriptional regulator [Burkholderiales bacterium]